jgi:hypothetical protein
LTFYQLLEKLKTYERIQVDTLLQELKNKTYLVEKLIDEQKELVKKAQTRSTPPKRSKSPGMKAIDFRDYIRAQVEENMIAGAAEPNMKDPERERLTLEIERLAQQNQALEQLLHQHQIPIPDSQTSAKSKVAFKIPDIHAKRIGSARIPRPPSSAASQRPQSGKSGKHSDVFVIPQLMKRPVSAAISSSGRLSRPSTAIYSDTRK